MQRIKRKQTSHLLTFQSLLFFTNYFISLFAQSATVINLNQLTSSQIITLTGSSGTGRAMDFADFNQDNVTDGAFGAADSSKVYLSFAPFNVTNLDNLNGTSGRVFTGANGTGVALKAAHLNNDTFMDLIIGTLTPKTYFVYGPDFPITNLDLLTEPYGKIVYGNSSSTAFAVADMNNDTHPDVGIGDFENNSIAFMFGPNYVTNLNTLNGSNGFILQGGSNLGISLCVRDMNNDTRPDVMAGAPNAGKFYLRYNDNFTDTNLDNINNTTGRIFSSTNTITGTGALASDVDGDGYPDILTDSRVPGILHLAFGNNHFPQTNLDTLSPPNGLNFMGQAGSGFPAFVYDFNLDNRPDIATSSLQACLIYLVYGPHFANATNLDALQQGQGVIIKGACGWAIGALLIGKNQLPAMAIGAQVNNSIYIIFNNVFNTPKASFTNLPTTSNTQATSSLTTNADDVIDSTTQPVATTSSQLIKTSTSSTPQTTITNATPQTNIATPVAITAVVACLAGGLVTALGIFAVKKCREEKIDYSQDAAMQELENHSLPRVRTHEYQSAVFAKPNPAAPVVYSTLGDADMAQHQQVRY